MSTAPLQVGHLWVLLQLLVVQGCLHVSPPLSQSRQVPFSLVGFGSGLVLESNPAGVNSPSEAPLQWWWLPWSCHGNTVLSGPILACRLLWPFRWWEFGVQTPACAFCCLWEVTFPSLNLLLGCSRDADRSCLIMLLWKSNLAQEESLTHCLAHSRCSIDSGFSCLGLYPPPQCQHEGLCWGGWFDLLFLRLSVVSGSSTAHA